MVRVPIEIPYKKPTTDKVPFGYIYLTTNTINHKKYVGKHKHTCFDTEYFGSGTQFLLAVKKYGIENFTCKPIDWAYTEDELNQKEFDWIEFLGCVKSDMYYNISNGGKGGLTSEQVKSYITPHTRELLSQHSRGSNNPMYSKGYKLKGSKNGMYHKQHTEASKQKMRENRGSMSGENNPFYGKHHSEASREKQRQIKLGKKASEETKLKMSKISSGRIWVNDNWEEERLIYPEQLQAYLSIHWKPGRLSYENKHKFLICKGEKDMSPLEIKVHYHEELYGELPKLHKIEQGDWVDLYSAEEVHLKSGQFQLVSLGFSMQLPKGYEAHIATRSSTYKNWKILMANSLGIIDESYAGDNDIWRFPALAMEDTVIHKGDKIAQFRLVEKMPEVSFEVVDHLDNPNRGGIGSTGKQ